MSRPVTDATTRLELRRRGTWRRRALRWGAAALTVVLLGVAVWALWFSPLLAVRTVEVHGQDLVTAAQVRELAAVPEGVSLLALDTGAIAGRVSGLAPVAEVAVTRVWPDRLRIDVTERVPQLAISSGTGYLIADADGVVFDARGSVPAGLVPVAADPADSDALVAAGTVYSALSPATAGRLTSIDVAGRDSISLRLRGGEVVFWGSAEDSELKAQVVDALLPLGGTRFDVSAPGHPTRR